MKFDDFTETLNGMVSRWNGKPADVRVALAALYSEVRNSTAFELAKAVEQRDEALRQLHKRLVKDDPDRGPGPSNGRWKK